MTQSSLTQFLAACGSVGPIRVGVGPKDGTPSESWTFQQPFLVIGRRPESDLVLDHWQVSRRHAYLQLIEGRYYCVDLGSRTGTHGGDASERSGWMGRGRAIQIGPYTVHPEWPTASARPSGPPTGVTWELPTRALGRAIWRMDRPLVLVGRSPACKIRIVEPDVSKFHCSLVLTPRGVWVVDLLGQKGVYINDEPVRCARLEEGDELRVGRHTLRPRYDSPPAPLARPAAPPEVARPGTLATLMPPSPFGLAPVAPPPSMISPSFDSRPSAGQDLAPYLNHAGGAVDPTIGLLVHQFGLMQQQMFDQFHHTMMMMFEGFAALHREQSATLREEFDQVRKLSQEIEALRAETARLANERPRPRPSTNGILPSVGLGSPGRDPAETPRKATPPPPDPEVDIHAQLCLRLAAIQGERQNRWQKILGMMASRS